MQGGIGTGKAVNVHARLTTSGDHLWDNPTTYGLPDGMWGLARVYPKPADAAGFTPSATAKVDDPAAAGNAPLQPLERTSLTVEVFADTDADGTRDTGEKATDGVQVRLLRTDGTPVLSTPTGADGRVSLLAAAGCVRRRGAGTDRHEGRR